MHGFLSRSSKGKLNNERCDVRIKSDWWRKQIQQNSGTKTSLLSLCGVSDWPWTRPPTMPILSQHATCNSRSCRPRAHAQWLGGATVSSLEVTCTHAIFLCLRLKSEEAVYREDESVMHGHTYMGKLKTYGHIHIDMLNYTNWKT